MQNHLKSAVVAIAVVILGASGQSFAGETITEITVANGEKRFQKLVTGTVYVRVCVDELQGSEVVTAEELEFGTTASKQPAGAQKGGGDATVNLLPPGDRCYFWETVPRTAVVAATLHKTHSDAVNNIRFNPATPDGDTVYKGCGIAAAQKFLAFYGVHKTQEQIKAVIPTFALGSNIAATPAHVRDGIRHFLLQAGITREVRMRNWLDQMTVLNSIGQSLHVKATPTIALVDDGSHYVVTFGWRGGQYYYNGPYDVMSNHVAETRSTIDTRFAAAGIWGSFGGIFSQAYGYTPGTLISLD